VVVLAIPLQYLIGLRVEDGRGPTVERVLLNAAVPGPVLCLVPPHHLVEVVLLVLEQEAPLLKMHNRSHQRPEKSTPINRE
jgi:hypothetical protein